MNGIAHLESYRITNELTIAVNFQTKSVGYNRNEKGQR